MSNFDNTSEIAVDDSFNFPVFDQEENFEDSSEGVSKEMGEETPTTSETVEPMPEDYDIELPLPEDYIENHRDLLDDFQEEEEETNFKQDEKIQKTLSILSSIKEIKGASVDLTDPEELQVILERGIKASESYDADDTVNRVLAAFQDRGLEFNSDYFKTLMDLEQGNPVALAKFIQSRGIDYNEIESILSGFSDTDLDAYTPPEYLIEKSNFTLNKILSDLKATESGRKTLEYVDGWDGVSKMELRKDHHLLKMIDTAIEKGLHDEVLQIVNKNKILGRGYSDYDYINYKTAFEKVIDNRMYNARKENADQRLKTSLSRNLSGAKLDPKNRKMTLAVSDIFKMNNDNYIDMYNKMR